MRKRELDRLWREYVAAERKARQAERSMLRFALKHFEADDVARFLGISRTTLWRRTKEHRLV